MTENENPSGSDEGVDQARQGTAGYPTTDAQQSTSVYPSQYNPYAAAPQYAAAPAASGPAQPTYAPSYPQATYGAPSPYSAGGHYPTTEYPTYGSPYGQTQYSPGVAQNPTGPQDPADEVVVGAATPSGGKARTVIAAAVLAAVLGGGVGGGLVAVADRHNNGSINTGIKVTNATGAPAAQTDGTIGAAATKIRPSVVTIDVSTASASATGSGVIIRDDGYILTNNHVVDGAGGSGSSIEVTLADGRTAAATVVGQDPPDDLAVIKVSGLDNLTSATFAKSSQLTVGQAVVAVGAPLGLSDTVTAGIVSNTARPVRTGSSSNNAGAVFMAIQTDAAINPGNSGGPLVDLHGSVVGINSAIANETSGSSEAGNIGIGFAIPSDEASRIAGELIAQGKAYHAVIGISVTDSQTKVTGVTVGEVNATGGAGQAGIKQGDIITAINGAKVRTADALIASVRSHAPGEQVTITFTRGSASQTVNVTLGKSDQ